jgi:alpha-1,6-mannosyltransferase
MLDGTGDQAADFRIWRVLLPYGPFWLLVTSALGSLGVALGGLLGEILVHKLLAAAGHLAAAVFIGRVAETRHPGFGGTTMLAIGLNPLLLLEGPMTGHNDFIAIGLLAFAAWRCAVRSPKTADLAIGLAIAIKITAAGVLPLILATRWKHSSGAGKWTGALMSLLLAAAPFVVLSLFVGGPGVVLNVVAGRFASMQPTTAVWVGRALLLLAFAWAMRLVIRTGDERYVAWTTGWAVVSAAIVLTTTTLRFPWYVAWPLVPVFAGWQERDRILMIAISVCGAMLLWRYSVAVG